LIDSSLSTEADKWQSSLAIYKLIPDGLDMVPVHSSGTTSCMICPEMRGYVWMLYISLLERSKFINYIGLLPQARAIQAGKKVYFSHEDELSVIFVSSFHLHRGRNLCFLRTIT
jgi:hypothetical protein